MAVASIQMGTAHVTLAYRPPSTDYKSVQNKCRLKGSRTPFTRHFCRPSFSVQQPLGCSLLCPNGSLETGGGAKG